MPERRSEPKPVSLGYAAPPRPRTAAGFFFGIYIVCALAGVVLVEPCLAQLLWGHPGDEVVLFFTLASMIATTVALIASWGYIRRMKPANGALLAIIAGMGCFIPGYAIMYLLSA